MPIEFPRVALEDGSRSLVTRQFSEKNTAPEKPEFSESPLPEITKAEQDTKIQKLQESLNEYGFSLKFSKDEQTDVLVVELIDQKTGAAIRQLPSEVSLKLAAELGKLQGLIYNRKA